MLTPGKQGGAVQKVGRSASSGTMKAQVTLLLELDPQIHFDDAKNPE